MLKITLARGNHTVTSKTEFVNGLPPDEILPRK